MKTICKHEFRENVYICHHCNKTKYEIAKAEASDSNESDKLKVKQVASDLEKMLQKKVDNMLLSSFEDVETKESMGLSDEELIHECRQSQIVTGWGQLSELLKRFVKYSVIVRQLRDSRECWSYPVFDLEGMKNFVALAKADLKKMEEEVRLIKKGY